MSELIAFNPSLKKKKRAKRRVSLVRSIHLATTACEFSSAYVSSVACLIAYYNGRGATFLVRDPAGLYDISPRRFDFPMLSFDEHVGGAINRFPTYSFAILPMSLWLISKLHVQAGIPLDHQSIYKLILVTISISEKMLEDENYPSSELAREFGFRRVELAQLERQCCQDLDWKFTMSRESYQEWTKFILHHHGHPCERVMTEAAVTPSSDSSTPSSN